MLNLYLFIELLSAADPIAVQTNLRRLELRGCVVKNVVQLADAKLVAHVDCETGEDATRVVLEKFMGIEGVVQTNIIAAVRPKNPS